MSREQDICQRTIVLYQSSGDQGEQIVYFGQFFENFSSSPCGVGSLVVSSPPTTEERLEFMGREIENRQFIGW
jgi:hypothetical protein